jgi:hypothetical protein
LLYAAGLHFFAGVLTGSMFKIETLLTVSIFVFCEVVVLVAADSLLVGVQAVGNLFAIQMGYCLGIYLRKLAEEAGYSLPPAQIRSRE